MSRIKVKNFGPIREGFVENDGWMDVKKVTVLIGNQGSGKSTVAKLISTLSWIEKDLYRSKGSTKRYRIQERVFKNHLEYHRIDGYLKNNTEIHYEGEAYKIMVIIYYFTEKFKNKISKVLFGDFLLPLYYPHPNKNKLEGRKEVLT